MAIDSSNVAPRFRFASHDVIDVNAVQKLMPHHSASYPRHLLTRLPICRQAGFSIGGPNFNPLRINYSTPLILNLTWKGEWYKEWVVYPENYTSSDWVCYP